MNKSTKLLKGHKSSTWLSPRLNGFSARIFYASDLSSNSELGEVHAYKTEDEIYRFSVSV